MRRRSERQSAIGEWQQAEIGQRRLQTLLPTLEHDHVTDLETVLLQSRRALHAGAADGQKIDVVAAAQRKVPWRAAD